MSTANRRPITSDGLYGVSAGFFALLLTVEAVSWFVGWTPYIFISPDDYLDVAAALPSIGPAGIRLDAETRDSLFLMQSFLLQFLTIELVCLLLLLILSPREISATGAFVKQTRLFAGITLLSILVVAAAPFYNCDVGQFRCNAYRAYRLLLGAGAVSSLLLPSLLLLTFCLRRQK